MSTQTWLGRENLHDCLFSLREMLTGDMHRSRDVVASTTKIFFLGRSIRLSSVYCFLHLDAINTYFFIVGSFAGINALLANSYAEPYNSQK
jgi:hypothetical protein